MKIDKNKRIAVAFARHVKIKLLGLSDDDNAQRWSDQYDTWHRQYYKYLTIDDNTTPDGQIIEDFLLWAINNDYIEFNKLLYLPENIKVKTDISTELIIKYLIDG